MKSAVHKAAGWLLNALLPRTCAHCAADLRWDAAEPLCPACLAGLEPLPELHCRACGLPLPDGGASCRDCRGSSPLTARAAFVFNPQLRSLVHALKYRGRDDLAPYLAGRMAAALSRFPELWEHKFAVAVPLHRSRARERGYNQAELLAAALAAEARLFHLPGAAERLRDTPSQTELSRERRRENVAGAFRVAAPELVKGRAILLIDDVATTLATLSSLAEELRRAGAASVAAFTLAREP
jgi:ComF family protein